MRKVELELVLVLVLEAAATEAEAEVQLNWPQPSAALLERWQSGVSDTSCNYPLASSTPTALAPAPVSSTCRRQQPIKCALHTPTKFILLT